MATMMFADEVVDPDALDELPAAEDVKTTDRELKMAQQLIDSLAGDSSPRSTTTSTARRCSS